MDFPSEFTDETGKVRDVKEICTQEMGVYCIEGNKDGYNISSHKEIPIAKLSIPNIEYTTSESEEETMSRQSFSMDDETISQQSYDDPNHYIREYDTETSECSISQSDPIGKKLKRSDVNISKVCSNTKNYVSNSENVIENSSSK